MNFSISRLALGIGKARCRLASDPTDVNERNDMQPLKTGETTTLRGFSKAASRPHYPGNARQVQRWRVGGSGFSPMM
ncbi:MAG: hypothetical protein J0H38_20005 [Rhizobiales bacterium]|nr:hypothetical protein [Hyphomicrobiales bacterium]